jgi:hypothetical protein
MSASIDFRSRSSRIRFGSFARVFKQTPSSAFERKIARLSVLYEDLRIELMGAALDEGAVSVLEPFGPHYRQYYFMRRAIGTLVEFQQTIEHIASLKEFREIEARAKKTSDVYYLEDWVPALKFFRKKRNLLKSIRNHVGGHFGDEATNNAFKAIGEDFTVRVEIQFDIGNRVRLLLPFATELSSAALLNHFPGSAVDERANALLNLLLEAVDHTVGIVHFLVADFLWDRLG